MAPTSTNPNAISWLLVMPAELLLALFHALPTLQSKLRLLSTCKTLHDILLPELYKSVVREHGWLPLSLAAAHDVTATLERCVQFGASVDEDCKGHVVSRSLVGKGKLKLAYNRPLATAVHFASLDATGWLLRQGANPNLNASAEEVWASGAAEEWGGYDSDDESDLAVTPLYLGLQQDCGLCRYANPDRTATCYGNNNTEEGEFKMQLNMGLAREARQKWLPGGKRYQIVRLLLEAGADPNVYVQWLHGYPLAISLTSCIVAGHDVFELLLKSGADPSQLCVCAACTTLWPPMEGYEAEADSASEQSSEEGTVNDLLSNRCFMYDDSVAVSVHEKRLELLLACSGLCPVLERDILAMKRTLMNYPDSVYPGQTVKLELRHWWNDPNWMELVNDGEVDLKVNWERLEEWARSEQ